MPTWGDILQEIQTTGQLLRSQGVLVAPQDVVRRKYLAVASALTKRPTILYASAWLTNLGAPSPTLLSVSDEDVHGFMEAVHGLSGPNLDLILHSPGGSASGAEAIVKYLRSKFDHIRIIVPHMAMSAATMIATSGDVVVMGNHSFLGPIDPQVILNTGIGARSVAAQAILEQFDLAKRDAADPVKLRVWAPMLSQYGPDLLVTCQNASDLSEALVSEWLASYLLKGQKKAKKKAKKIARWLATHGNFKTHARPLSRDQLRAEGMPIDALEANRAEQDAFLSVYHAAAHTFSSTPALKIIENHLGKAFIKQGAVQQFQVFPQFPLPQPPQPPQPPQQPPHPQQPQPPQVPQPPAPPPPSPAPQQQPTGSEATTSPSAESEAISTAVKFIAAQEAVAAPRRSARKKKRSRSRK